MGKLGSRARTQDWEAQQSLVGSGPRDPLRSSTPAHLSPADLGLGQLQLHSGTAARSRVKHRGDPGGWQAGGTSTSSSLRCLRCPLSRWESASE